MLESCLAKIEADSDQLAARLVADIQRLQSKVVCLRYSLSWHLEKHAGEMLRVEILSDLHGAYDDLHAYRRFVSVCCGGHDPLDSGSHAGHLLELSKGGGCIDF
jgi:hypothetical protein